MMDAHDTALMNMHGKFLDALRHREQDIIQFLGILGPALGGFIWLLGDLADHPFRFVAGTYGVLLVLFMGASYTLALGYNYRYMILQLAKLEAHPRLCLREVTLAYWPRRVSEFKKGSRWGFLPWCTPPDIIRVFWLAFLICIIGVTVVAWVADRDVFPIGATSQPVTAHEGLKAMKAGIPVAGVAAFFLSLIGPIIVGNKMLRACRKESEWAHECKNEELANGRSSMADEQEALTDMCRLIATFGLLAAILLCLGVPVAIALLPNINDTFRHWVVFACEALGLVIVATVFLIMWGYFVPKEPRGDRPTQQRQSRQ